MMRRAVLVVERKEGDIREAIELARSAGYQVLDVVGVKSFGQQKYGVSTGKIDEVKESVNTFEADTVIVDFSLKSSQSFNLRKAIKVDIIDREKLILEIFAKRARTPEAKLQVKLAEMTYELPRIRELVRRVRLGEQPGLYGYGEYEVERYYDHVRRLQVKIRRELQKVQVHRKVQRVGRRRWGMPFISLAGYTGVGKTTLFNALAKERKAVSDMAFTTLTTTTRSMWLAEGKYAVLTDTVGFISRIPHYMIEAFKSTLEELTFADVVLLVVDMGEPVNTMVRKLETSYDILQELSVDKGLIIPVFNKVDLLETDGLEHKVEAISQHVYGCPYVLVSARRKIGFDSLREAILRIVGRFYEERPYLGAAAI